MGNYSTSGILVLVHPTGKVAKFLGYAGLIPFIGLTLVLFIADEDTAVLARFAFQAYAAIILTFIGGVHWGLIVNEKDFNNVKLVMTGSIVPSLLAWFSILLPLPVGLAILLLSFLALFFYEYKFLWPTLFPPWYRRLRSILTGIVCLLITFNLVGSL